MIVYLDTSAFVPMFIDEPTTTECRALWEVADQITSTRLLFVEAASALARAVREGRTTEATFRLRQGQLALLWNQVKVIELDTEIMERAAMMTSRFSLRGFDAVHCAAGEAVGDESALMASADRSILHGWHELGLRTFDPKQN